MNWLWLIIPTYLIGGFLALIFDSAFGEYPKRARLWLFAVWPALIPLTIWLALDDMAGQVGEKIKKQ